MASGWEQLRAQTSKRLFGKELTLAEMTPEQREKFGKQIEEIKASPAGKMMAITGGFSGYEAELKDAELSDRDRELGERKESTVERLLGEAGASAGENKEFFEGNVTPALEAYKKEGTNANAVDAMALEFKNRARETYQGKLKDLSKEDREALAKYMGETDPLMAQREAGGWGEDVKADAEGLGAQREALEMALGDAKEGGADQRDVMERNKALTSPEATGKERYLAEMARRNFEAQDRGNREAVMQNLSQRGLNSGTLQIANNLAAQERLGQDRTMAELGLQAGAVDRSMRALEGYGAAANSLRSGNQAANQQYGNQANSLRTANDALAQFNKSGSQVAQRFQDTYAQDEARRVGDLAGSRNQTTRSTIQADEGRATSGYNADNQYATDTAAVGENRFTRAGEILGGAQGAAATRVGVTSPGTTTQIEALKTALGEDDAEQATIAAQRMA